MERDENRTILPPTAARPSLFGEHRDMDDGRWEYRQTRAPRRGFGYFIKVIWPTNSLFSKEYPAFTCNL